MTQSILKDDESSDRYLSVEQASELTGMSVAWFRRGCWSGDAPPHIKLGRAVRWKRSILIAWMDGQERQTTSDISTSKR